MSAETPPRGPARIEAGAIGTEHRLAAQLSARHFRGLRLASLQVLALTSLPLWLQAHGLGVPGWLAWLSLLVAGACLALAVVYAALERRWSRLARGRGHAPRAFVHIARSTWDWVRGGLWGALAGTSLLPWASALIARPVPAWLLGPLTAVAAVLGGTVLAGEIVRGARLLEAAAFRQAVDAGSEGQHQEPRDARARRLDDAS